jgi:hypothetical protein
VYPNGEVGASDVGRAVSRKHVVVEADVHFEKEKNTKEKINKHAGLHVFIAQNVGLYNNRESLNPYYTPPLHLLTYYCFTWRFVFIICYLILKPYTICWYGS